MLVLVLRRISTVTRGRSHIVLPAVSSRQRDGVAVCDIVSCPSVGSYVTWCACKIGASRAGIRGGGMYAEGTEAGRVQ